MSGRAGTGRSVKRKYLTKDTDRHGNVRWYVRRDGRPKIRLPCGPDEPDFEQAYWLAFNEGLAQERSASPEPKTKLKPSRATSQSYVYFLRTGSSVKIGYSSSPASRIDALKTALADRITTFVCVSGSQADERAMHRTLAKHRQEGEWFAAHPDVIRAMVRAAAYGIKAAISETGEQP